MAEISAGIVAKLRKMSGQGMMDCKKALEEAAGNLDEAMTILRKKGLATLQKRADRDTTEGRVVCKSSGDGNTALVSLCCETDFVANSDDFKAAADVLGDYALACKSDDGVENLLATEVKGRKYSDVLTETVSKTGEKTEVGDYAKFKLSSAGLVGTYVHFNNKVGVMVEIETDSADVAGKLKQAGSDIAMHITASRPVSVDRSGVDAETIAREKAVAAEQVKDKPANIVDKIVEGKLSRFFSENCLIDQPFVKDDKVSVGKYLEAAAKQAGGSAKIKRFVRFEIG